MQTLASDAGSFGRGFECDGTLGGRSDLRQLSRMTVPRDAQSGDQLPVESQAASASFWRFGLSSLAERMPRSVRGTVSAVRSGTEATAASAGCAENTRQFSREQLAGVLEDVRRAARRAESDE